MPNTYDVIVVGARCAGSPVAMLLARKGYRVLVVDRATFPSDHPSTHFLHTPAVALLRKWQLLEEVLDSGAPPITRIVWGMDDVVLEGPPPRWGEVDYAVGPRRTVLDKILRDAAEKAGAEVREGFTVTEVLFDDGRVAGIRGRDSEGTESAATARLVIGADGMGSTVAKSVRPQEIMGAPAETAVWYSYWHGTGIDHEIFVRVDGREVFIIPTNDGNVNVMVGWRHHEMREFRRDVEGNYRRTLELFPDVARQVLGGTRVEQFYAFSDTRQWMRQTWGPGWALLGDAAHLKDPVAGIGITDSFRTADRLADVVDDVLSGRRAEADAYGEYQVWRDETFGVAFQQHLRAAKLQIFPPDMLDVVRACQYNDANRVAFFGLLGAINPMHEFFSPENSARIKAEAAAAQRRSRR